MKRSIWIFDFDGTLAPIVADRNAARIHPACRTLLADLVQEGKQCVAVLSSRRLEDLSPRIDIPGLYCGGDNGLKWITPKGQLRDRSHGFQKDLPEKRNEIMPFITALKDLPGLDIEDKVWSVTLHLRQMPPEAKEEVQKRIRTWQTVEGISLRQGPEAWEIAFSPSFNKSVGVEILCHEIDFQGREDLLIYAGDDENDALAMKTVASLGGITITVGPRPLHPECRLTEDPAALAVLCREMSHAPRKVQSGDTTGR